MNQSNALYYYFGKHRPLMQITGVIFYLFIAVANFTQIAIFTMLKIATL